MTLKIPKDYRKKRNITPYISYRYLENPMSKKLNKAAYDLAKQMIEHGFELEHDENNWAEVKPTPEEVTRYLEAHDIEEYGAWFLGVDPQADSESTAKYAYPFGDFSVVHKSALLEAEKKATMNKDLEIAQAAKRLLQLIK